MEYGIRWSEFDKQDRIVVKQKFFNSEKKVDKWIDKLEKKDNFNTIVAFYGLHNQDHDEVEIDWA
jgi:hypothetical protein